MTNQDETKQNDGAVQLPAFVANPRRTRLMVAPAAKPRDAQLPSSDND